MRADGVGAMTAQGRTARAGTRFGGPGRLTPIALGAAVGFAALASPAASVETDACRPAEAPVVIEADRMTYRETDDLLQFVGEVEARHEGRVLRADRVVWDRASGTVEIPGPFTVSFPDGNEVAGERGSFDDSLGAGSVTSVNALLRNGPARVTAESGERNEAGELHLLQASFSPCPVSEDNPEPAWRVRSASVVHDAAAQEIVYSASVLEIGGLPVFVAPYLRQPDPSVDRRSGFLTPEVRTNSAYGVGLRVPYYLAIAPDRHATLTAFAMTKEGVVMEGRYQRLFADGDLDVDASLGHKAILEPEVKNADRTHGHFFLNLDRAGERRYRYGVHVNLASEKGYLRRYGYSDEDRLRNRVYVERFTPEVQFEAESVAFQSQRDTESSRGLNFTLPEVRMHRVSPEPVLGGEFRFGGDVRVLNCQDCRRSLMTGLEGEWQRVDATDYGLVATLHARLRGDLYSFSAQDKEPVRSDGTRETYDDTTRVLTQAGMELSLPLIRSERQAAHIVEPVVQAILSPREDMSEDVPNEDSLDVEFDEHSLFARNRFSGRDRIETGNRMAYGARYRYRSAGGTGFGAVVGRVLRQRPLEDFPRQSGLRERHSDIVGAWDLRYRAPMTFRMNHRVRLSSDLNMRRNDFTLRGEAGRFDLSGTYLFVDADTDRGTFEAEDRGEVQTELGIRLAPRLRMVLDHRRDIQNHRTIQAGTELRYEHECFDLLVSAERDFVGSDNAPAGTTLGLSLHLIGF